MICKTNHLLFDHQYKLFIENEYILIGKDKNSIKYKVQLQSSTLVSWIFSEFRFFGFKLYLKQKWKQFDMNHNDCLKFKYLLDGKVCYNSIELLYNFGETIGLGSYSEVILVINKYDNNKYAAKKMQLNKKNVHQILQNELKALQILKHKHIVQLKEFFIQQAECYLIFNYIEGESLSKFFRYNKRKNLQEIICILKQLLEVLHYIHSKGFIHKDIKPENIIIDKNHKNATVIDFGFASRIDENQINAGTPGYIAPELFKNKEPTDKCDIFSLGSILYEMIYGEKLFKGESLNDIQNANMKCEFNLSLLDHPLHHLLYQMLQKKVKLRINAEQGLILLKQIELSIHI